MGMFSKNPDQFRQYEKEARDRIAKHNAGKGAKYTKSRLPVELMAVSKGLSRSDALRLERYIKRQPVGEKIAALHENG